MSNKTETVATILEAGNGALPNEIIGLLLVIGIILTAIIVLMRKSPFYVIGRIVIFLATIIKTLFKPVISLLRVFRIISRAKVKAPSGTPVPGPSVAVAFARTVAKKTETDITLELGFEETIEKLQKHLEAEKRSVINSYKDIPASAKIQLKEIDVADLIVHYLANELDENLFNSDILELPGDAAEENIQKVVATVKLILLRKALDQLTEREQYELRILKTVSSKERELYIQLDSQALKDLHQTQKSMVHRSGLVFSKLDIQEIIDDDIYEEEDKSTDLDANGNKKGQAADRDLVKAKYFFTYDVPVRSKINPQSLFEDVQGSNIVELFRFSDRKNFFILSEMRKMINANIMKLSVLLSAIVYVVFILNIFFSASIPFTKGFILPYLPEAASVQTSPQNIKKQPVIPAEIKQDTPENQPEKIESNEEKKPVKEAPVPPATQNKESLRNVIAPEAKHADSSDNFLTITRKDIKQPDCKAGEKSKQCGKTIPVVNVSIAGILSFYLEAQSIDKAIFGIFTCLLGMFVMWLFYQKEYTEFQLYNGTRLDNFMQRCLNRISVNYQICVSNNVLSMQKPDNLNNMIENSSKWTTLLPWISFRAFYLEFFLRNVMYQILRNSSYYLLFIPIVFFLVILATVYVIDFQVFMEAVFAQNTFYVLFLLLIYLYYRYLRESVTFILDTIKEETWQEFHDLKIHNSMKRYVQAWAQNLKQWRDARRSTDGN